jgi:membrane dipeptidase
MKEGGVNGQVFAIWVDPKSRRTGEYVPYVSRMIDGIERLCVAAAADIAPARTPAEFGQVVASDLIAAVLGIEGGHALEGDIENVDRFFARGVRVLTVTWCNSNELADGGWDKNQPHGGLSTLGRDAVRRMNEIGMMVDVSHCSEKAFFDILDATSAPVIASHSGVAALYQHHSGRNLTDEQIRKLAQNRGVVGVVFLPAFLRPDEGKGASVEDVVNCLDHICQLVGPKYAALGSDFDGFEGALAGLEDVSRMPAIAAGLRQRGFPDADVEKILGANFLRVWDAVQNCA